MRRREGSAVLGPAGDPRERRTGSHPDGVGGAKDKLPESRRERKGRPWRGECRELRGMFAPSGRGEVGAGTELECEDRETF